jgi:ribosomal protein L9
MNVRILNKKTEIEKINAFVPFEVKASDLPGHTFAAVYKDDIVAIAGLRLMEGEVCFIDSMASNQNFESTVRHEALDLLTQTILDLAKNLGFKKIFATTREECIIERAERHGFKVSKEKIILRAL